MLKFLIVLVISFSTYVSAKETKFEKRLQKDIKKLLEKWSTHLKKELAIGRKLLKNYKILFLKFNF